MWSTVSVSFGESVSSEESSEESSVPTGSGLTSGAGEGARSCTAASPRGVHGALGVAMVCLVSGYVAFRLSPSSRLVAALSSWGGFDGRQATGQVQMLKQLLSVDSSWAL